MMVDTGVSCLVFFIPCMIFHHVLIEYFHNLQISPTILELTENDITGGLIEEEGIFGFSLGLVAATTNFTVSVTLSVTSAALNIASDATSNFRKVLAGSPTSDENCVTKVGSQSNKSLDPSLVNLAATVSHMILDAAYPLLTSPTSLLRFLTCETKSEPPLLRSSSSDVTFHTAKSHESLNSFLSLGNDETDTSEAVQNKSNSPTSISSCQSDRTPSLSTLSEGSAATADESEEDYGEDIFRKFVDTSELNTTKYESDDDLSAKPLLKRETIEPDEIFSPSYYMNFSAMLLQDSDHEQLSALPLAKNQKEDVFFVFSNSPTIMPRLKCMLDIMVQSALSLAREDSANIDNKCPVWKPEGDTKKTLQRILKWSCNERTKALTNTVLKWTGVLANEKEELRLIKTRGIINMSPLDLKNLLIDCSRGHLVNKNSLGKKDIWKFPCNIGTTTIVENTMKVPFVGGEIHSVSLTHSRFVQNDPIHGDNFYVIVSKSVQNELDKPTGLPYYSISVLRPVQDNKTDLVNVAQISEVPVPKFLVNKIAFTGAVDFFTNLRSIV